MITSAKNPKIQKIRGLFNNKKDRLLHNEYVLEGVRLLEEARSARIQPTSVIFSDDLSERGHALLDFWHDANVPLEKVLPDILRAVAGTEHSQGILAEFKIPNTKLPAKWSLLLVLDQLRDPGNVGTLLRTAWAMNVDAVILTPNSADLYNPKTLRAGMGAHFHLPVLSMDRQEISHLSNGKQLVLTDSAAEIPCWSIDFGQSTILAIGSEADGLQKTAFELPHKKCLIPMQSRTESLNAATAGSILLYEIYRQRAQ